MGHFRRLKFVMACILGVLFSCTEFQDGELLYIEPHKGSLFNYPYFLFIPKNISSEGKSFVVIEPNNSGFADDDFRKHIEKAKRIASNDFYIGNFLARTINTPLIVPIFPRTKSEWTVYTHALDRDAMTQKGNSLERMDVQLIEMFKHARNVLKDKNIEAEDQFLMTGFSASGTFVNRFTLIHPDKVKAVAAGGVNGILILPVDSMQGTSLEYPIGTCDFKTLFGEKFQKEAFANTAQFYFMGSLDNNDALPFDDAYHQNEREKVYTILGQEMQSERWSRCSIIYNHENIKATIKTYENIGHEHPVEIKKDVLNFFLQTINED